MKSVLSLAFGLLVCLQTVFSQTTIRMIVHEESKPCRRMMEQTCLQVQKNGSSEWELFYESIKGFTFEPGYRYEIDVIQTERPEPVPEDLPRYLYRLDKVISKTAVSSSTGEMHTMELEKVAPPANMWKVVSLNGLQLNTDELYFGLNEEETAIAGKSGCNQFNTAVKFNKKKSKVKTNAVASTMMMCSEEAMKLEKDFNTSLADRSFKISKMNDQWIWKRKGKVVLVLEKYEPIVKEDVTERTPWDYFNGKTLKVIQLNGEEIEDSKAHLVFNTETSSFSGNNGCNQVSGTYKVNGNSISFSKVATTKMACLDEMMQATERSIQAILGTKSLTVDFAESVMNIYDASGKLVMMLAVDGSK